MGVFSRLFARGRQKEILSGLFFEHPTGEFASTLQAIESAMGRLDAIEMAGRWITFSGQGQGSTPDSYHIIDVEYSDGKFKTAENAVDLPAVLKAAGLDEADLGIRLGSGGVVYMGKADPGQRGRFLDALLRQHGVRPFEGESDYAVGAEWSDDA